MRKVVYVSKNAFSASVVKWLHYQRTEGDEVDCVTFNKSAKRHIIAHSPDIVVFDIDYVPEHAFLSLMNDIRAHFEKVRIIAVATEVDNESLLILLKHGIDSFVKKDSMLEERLATLMKQVEKQHYLIPSESTRYFIDRLLELKNLNLDLFHQRLLYLSRREAEVAYLMKQGLKNLEIAEKLAMNEGTVKVHVSHIYKKLGMKGRKRVVQWLQELFVRP
ncbi:response regulator transcription factor [Oceanobacillus bengalensis]|uniref:DNA-binding response regulator n=1 Tax=Oceanobacillus bengalensis TaxID=1435466 RepID=A0A494YSK8_9BACI|nr:response regulator transcription factor [Oceanobacillus bengalensis]RKQ12969.1 DNA-binding response regulator [Oceanobacillus bengalensis]